MELTNAADVPVFWTSDATDKLDQALAKAQGEIEAAAKDKANPAFRSKYADMTSVWEACRAPLAKHAVSVTQWPLHSTDGRLHLITRVAHAGQWICSHFSVPVSKQDAHGFGSATTYAKRYALCAALGVVADEDDDGQAAVQSREKLQEHKSTPKRQQDTGEAATEKQIALLRNLLASHVFTDIERAGIEKKITAGLTKVKATEIIDRTKATMDERKEIERQEQEGAA